MEFHGGILHGITSAFDVSWDDCNTQEKLETMAIVNKVHYGLCENNEFIFRQLGVF